MPEEFVYMVAEGNLKKYKDGWSKWRTPEEHKKKIKAEPNYGLIRPETLCLETDYDNPAVNREVMIHVKKLLDTKGAAYRIATTGHKSDHCESDWQGLEQVEPEIRPKVKARLAEWLTNKELAKDFDESNFGNKRMLQLLGRPHRKTGSIKTLVWERKGTNKMPVELVEAVRKQEAEKPTQKNYPIPAPTRCHFLEYCLSNKVDLQNKQQNSRFSPNAFAYFQGNQGLLEKLVVTQSQENLTVARLLCWKQYKPKFRCDQLQFFVKKENLWETICRKCPNRRPITKEEWKTIKLINTARRM